LLCFFLPIEKQLKYFIEHHGLDDKISDTPPNSRGDVNTGDIYRKLREEGKIDKNTVTGQINLDGASAFKVYMNPTCCSKKMYKTAWY
jgi:hypothetical protein